MSPLPLPDHDDDDGIAHLIVLARGNIPPAIDLLAALIERTRPMLATGTTKRRMRVLWAAAKPPATRRHRRHHWHLHGAGDRGGFLNRRGRWTGDDVREICAVTVQKMSARDHSGTARMESFRERATQMISPKWDSDEFERDIMEEVERVTEPKGGESARGAKKRNGSAHQLLPVLQVPMAVARMLSLSAAHMTDTHAQILAGGWWQWQRSRWCEFEDRAVRSLLYAFTECALYDGDKELAALGADAS